jgi:hypothetical protein
MMARGVGLAACLSLLLASGCVCRGPCGVVRDPLACAPDCGNNCMPALRYDRVWRGNCNECGPGCGGAGSYYQCGALAMLRGHLSGSATCGKGCGEVYWGEWVSDPPDCCDPCNSCGDWQNQQCCSPGLLRRVWWGAHGYRLGGQHGDANCCGGCNGCGSCGGGGVQSAAYYDGGSPGCSTCGGGHGDGMHYGSPTQGHGPASGGSILNENWESEPLPTTNRPIHSAQQPMPARSAMRAPARQMNPTAQRMPVQQQQRQTMPATQRVARPAGPQYTKQATNSPRSPRPWSPVATNQLREEMR